MANQTRKILIIIYYNYTQIKQALNVFPISKYINNSWQVKYTAEDSDVLIQCVLFQFQDA